ncbi:hypothetical protein GDO81_005666 [Engystomops pustulosus]|uniref:Uncharacterized protein n=1 Tax=Engystomops pustulosus TaxID=76066 RepID=A0AAV7CQU2_ENGPU|nr:hypothetical protein GDO81_005666 [Engystomops pustulosus]
MFLNPQELALGPGCSVSEVSSVSGVHTSKCLPSSRISTEGTEKDQAGSSHSNSIAPFPPSVSGHNLSSQEQQTSLDGLDLRVISTYIYI